MKLREILKKMNLNDPIILHFNKKVKCTTVRSIAFLKKYDIYLDCHARREGQDIYITVS